MPFCRIKLSSETIDMRVKAPSFFRNNKKSSEVFSESEISAILNTDQFQMASSSWNPTNMGEIRKVTWRRDKPKKRLNFIACWLWSILGGDDQFWVDSPLDWNGLLLLRRRQHSWGKCSHTRFVVIWNSQCTCWVVSLWGVLGAMQDKGLTQSIPGWTDSHSALFLFSILKSWFRTDHGTG